ncbi:MAG: Holliday junction resolvase RuvX [Spirosomaceae bacterium]|nr:Holliday junction resolvase RuvX [Spirosomataceae bacterium]
MPRILALDYGGKRTGIAVTDPLKIIASALTTVPSNELLKFLQDYCSNEAVESFVIGYPVSLKGESTDGTKLIEKFVEKLKSTFPEIPVNLIDERFTSKIAMQSMIASGMSKKSRREKGNVDKVSAVIILQDYLSQNF